MAGLLNRRMSNKEFSNVEVRRSELLAVAEVRRQKVEVRRQKVEVREALLADPNTLQHARGA